MAKKITYQAIAEKTGISVSTISRIINGTTAVSEDKKAQVLRAMEELGSDIAAFQGKDADKSAEPLVLVQLNSISNPFCTEVIRGIRTVAEAQGCDVLIREQGEINIYNIEQLLKVVRRINVSGIICMDTLQNEVQRRLKLAVPFVHCGERDEDGLVPYVSIDDESSAYKAVEMLIMHGNKNIVLVNGPRNYRYAQGREAGYRKALAAFNLECKARNIIYASDINYDMALSSVSQIFYRQDRPDAVFAASDVLAAAVLSAAKSSGLRVPEDVEVIGFDNTDISRMCIPSITTVSQPRYQMGLTSCEMLLKLIRGEENVQSIMLNTELVLRDSTR